MAEFDSQMKPCRYCGQPVKVSSYRCPHCNSSLAATEQEVWEQSAPAVEPSAESREDAESRFTLRIPPSAGAVLFVIAICAVFFLSVYRFLTPGNNRADSGELSGGFEKRAVESARSGRSQPTPEAGPLITIHENSGPPEGSDASPREVAGKPEDAPREQADREERIEDLSARLFGELRKEGTIKTSTIYLKSGRAIRCDIVDESDEQVTIKLGGLTTSLDTKAIERIDRRPPEVVEKELKELALARATEIVDQGLVRHGNDWITPAERARRTQAAGKRKQTAGAKSKPVAHKKGQGKKRPPGGLLVGKSDRKKLESLLSLVRKMGVIKADFFGGTLRLQDETGKFPASSSGNRSFVAFEADARRLDILKVCRFLQLPVAASGVCNVKVEAALDQRDFRTLDGDAHVSGRKMTIPPLDIAMFRSPRNQNAKLSASFSARDGVVTIEHLRIEGPAYSIEGDGTIHLAKRPEQSRIDGAFLIYMMEPPTVIEGKSLGKGTQFVIDAFVGSGQEFSVRLSGRVSAPKVELITESPFGALTMQLD